MTDVILNALEDLHIIVNQLCVMTRKLDAGIALLPEVSGESFRTQTGGDENGPLDTTEPTGLLSESTSKEMNHDAMFMKETREIMSASEKTGNNLLCENTPSDRKESLKLNDESRRDNEKSKHHDVVTVGYIYIIYL